MRKESQALQACGTLPLFCCCSAAHSHHQGTAGGRGKPEPAGFIQSACKEAMGLYMLWDGTEGGPSLRHKITEAQPHASWLACAAMW